MTSQKLSRPVKQLVKIPILLKSTSQPEMSGPMQEAITNKLMKELNPSHLVVVNESYMHNVPKDSETHFKVVVVSKKFEQLTLLQRHRLVNQILENELASSVHALSVQAKTPEQWEASGGKATKSPPCLGGAGR